MRILVGVLLLGLACPSLSPAQEPGFEGLVLGTGTGTVASAATHPDAASGSPRAAEPEGWVDLRVNPTSSWHFNTRHFFRYTVRGQVRTLTNDKTDADRFVDALQRIRRQGGIVSQIELKGHGAPELQTLGGETFLMATNRQVLVQLRDGRDVDITRLLLEVLAPDAKIDLNGCQTGRGEAPVAMELSRALPGRTVVGGSAWAQVGIPFSTKSFGSRRWYRNGVLVSDRWYRVD